MPTYTVFKEEFKVEAVGLGKITGVTWSRMRKPASVYWSPSEDRFTGSVHGSLIFEEDQEDVPERFDIHVYKGDELVDKLCDVELVYEGARWGDETAHKDIVYHFVGPYSEEV